MDTEEQRGHVVRLCGLVHALVNEVEAEREQLLDAQGSLAEVVQRLVRQDEAWKDRNGHLEVQERAIRVATSNAGRRRSSPGGVGASAKEEAEVAAAAAAARKAPSRKVIAAGGNKYAQYAAAREEGPPD